MKEQSGRHTRSIDWALIALFATVMLCSGCRTNYLPEYLPLVETANVMAYSSTGPKVYVGQTFQTDEPAAILTETLTAEVSKDLEEKLTEAAPSDALVETISDIFAAQLEEQLAIDITDPEDEIDARIEVTVTEYGIAAQSMESQVYYILRCRATMVYVPENKVVWETTEVFQYPIKPTHVYGDDPESQAVATAVNIMILQDLTVEQLNTVFMGMANEAGNALFVRFLDDSKFD